MKKKVYLRPAHDGKYVPQIALRMPSEDAVLLTAIREYPTTIKGICYDAYGQGHFFERDVTCETELLYELFACGSNQCPIAKLWDLDISRDYSDDIGDFFDRTYYGRLSSTRLS